MRKTWTIFIGLMLLTARAHALTAPELIERIDQQGPRAVVDDLAFSKDTSQWAFVLSQIESGDPAWLEVAIRLKPGTDASTSESLSIAVALALPNAPANVLPLTDHGFTLTHMCSAPLIEPPHEVFVSLVERTIRALEAAALPASLAATRDQCLATLRDIQLKDAQQQESAF